MIDLHVHTTMSDGTLTASEIVKLAKDKGLIAIAITDHDTISGIGEAIETGRRLGLEVIPGVEISGACDYGILHILGYFLDYTDVALLSGLDYLRNQRKARISKILNKLLENNVFISEADVVRESHGSSPGRPHLANLMYESGYVKTRQEAFDKYLRKGACAYVPKVKLEAEDAIRLISNAGGIAGIAHPHSLNIDDPEKLHNVIKSFVQMGLGAIEAYYPQHTDKQTRLFLKIAEEFDLVVTGGTDFHGSNKPGVELGMFPGINHISYDIVENIKSRLPKR